MSATRLSANLTKLWRYFSLHLIATYEQVRCTGVSRDMHNVISARNECHPLDRTLPLTPVPILSDHFGLALALARLGELQDLHKSATSKQKPTRDDRSQYYEVVSSVLTDLQEWHSRATAYAELNTKLPPRFQSALKIVPSVLSALRHLTELLGRKSMTKAKLHIEIQQNLRRLQGVVKKLKIQILVTA